MKVVVGLGGHALLRRGEPLTGQAQRLNITRAAEALSGIARKHRLVVTHGNGPQVGMLAVQDATSSESGNFSLDVIGAETEGMIGYLLAQELHNELPARNVATILTQVEVDPDDPAFQHPVKPVGPVYGEEEAEAVARTRGWTMAPDGHGYRRVVPSPAPLRILEIETIRLLMEANTIVVCAGGGGIPIVFDPWVRAHGVEAVIDKDRSTALVARELGADVLMLLTDVPAVQADWGTPQARDLTRITADEARELDLPAGSMGPKVEAALAFVEGSGGRAVIGEMQDAEAMLAGEAGTQILPSREAQPSA